MPFTILVSEHGALTDGTEYFVAYQSLSKIRRGGVHECGLAEGVSGVALTFGSRQRRLLTRETPLCD